MKAATASRRTAQTLPPPLEMAEVYCIDDADWEPSIVASRLGPQRVAGGVEVRCRLPGARAVALTDIDTRQPLTGLDYDAGDGLFKGQLPAPCRYRLQIEWPDAVEEAEDPYAFAPLDDAMDRHLLAEGTHLEMGRRFGAQPMVMEGVAGVRFSVWAPNARQVAVLGDFNLWSRERHLLRRRRGASVWELFIPGVLPGSNYSYRIVGADGSDQDRADPLACQATTAPGKASVIGCAGSFLWNDADWMTARGRQHRPDRPISIYEVHAGSWRRDPQDPARPLNWPALAEQLIPYVVEQGFTHIELLPVMSHPFGGSWGYQPLGQFAPQPDYGTPLEFAAFVDRAHAAGIGVILDWVPAHFPSDPHGLARFDGTPLYEHADPKEGLHQDWGTLIYDLGRPEVRAFLISSALHWLEMFHVDGLRVDAVASMLYRDYSRADGEWIPNKYGGRENLESVAFLQQLNRVIRERVPAALVIAEESTAWPGVTEGVPEGGLGFGYKWNMGWMNDTLHYMHKDAVHRRFEHHKLTFGLVYAFSERFILPLSHDEVVHGKGSLLRKMPGDRWQQFASLRAYFGFMWAHPGKKLLFMGGEIAQAKEWNHDASVDWPALGDASHAGVQRTVRDLNRLYRERPEMHQRDHRGDGFEWLVGDDQKNSVLAFLRRGEQPQDCMLAVCNFTPVPRRGYRLGVPQAGEWQLVFNSDAACYAGSDASPAASLQAVQQASHGRAWSIVADLPPLATVYFLLRSAAA